MFKLSVDFRKRATAALDRLKSEEPILLEFIEGAKAGLNGRSFDNIWTLLTRDDETTRRSVRKYLDTLLTGAIREVEKYKVASLNTHGEAEENATESTTGEGQVDWRAFLVALQRSVQNIKFYKI